MKILFLNYYSGTNNRGAETFIHSLAVHLAVRHQVTIASVKPLTLPGVANKIISTPIHQPIHSFSASPLMALLKRFFLDPASLSVLLFTLKAIPEITRKHDIVIPLNGFWQLLICKVVNLFSQTKIVVTGHSGPGWDERWNLYLCPDVFVATTGPTLLWAKQTSPWTRSVLIPYGIDIKQFTSVKPTSLKLEKPIILCPAAAVPYKQIPLAIKAVALLKKGSLLHLGTGPQQEKIQSLGQDLLGPKRFASIAVPTSEMPSYYASSDLITLPSSSQENSPMVFLESLAAGKLVVTTDAPRPRWLLGPAGNFVNPQNANTYAQAISLTLVNKNAGTTAHSQAKQYDITKISLAYEQLFKFLLSGKSQD